MNIRNLAGRVALSFLSLVVLSSAVTAAIPNTINYQGYLTNLDTGLPENGPKSITFSLYSAPDSVTALWCETKTVSVSDGVYSTELGTGNTAPCPTFSTLTFDAPYYLGIKIGDDSEMTPRLPLTSVSYALMANTVMDNAITSSKIADGTVDTSDIKDSSVTGTKLVSNAVTAAKITDGTITNAKLASSALTVAAGTGLSGGGSVSLGGSTTLNLANTGVTPGIYTRANISVDAQGRIISAFNGGNVNLTTEVSGTLPVASGGTGRSAATAGSYLSGNGIGALVEKTPAEVKADLALVKGDVGLGNVDDTADANKPISGATQEALDLKAPLASPTFTGTVSAASFSGDGAGLTGVVAAGVLVSAGDPGCVGVSDRGKLWLEPAAGGLEDSVRICRKDAADNYSWKALW